MPLARSQIKPQVYDFYSNKVPLMIALTSPTFFVAIRLLPIDFLAPENEKKAARVRVKY